MKRKEHVEYSDSKSPAKKLKIDHINIDETFNTFLHMNTSLCSSTILMVHQYLGIPRIFVQKVVDRAKAVAIVIQRFRNKKSSFKGALLHTFLDWPDANLSIFNLPEKISSQTSQKTYSQIYSFRFRENPNLFFRHWSWTKSLLPNQHNRQSHRLIDSQFISRLLVNLDEWISCIKTISINELGKGDCDQYFIGLLGGHNYREFNSFTLGINFNGKLCVETAKTFFSQSEEEVWKIQKETNRCEENSPCKCDLCKYGTHDQCTNCFFKQYPSNLLIHKLTE